LAVNVLFSTICVQVVNYRTYILRHVFVCHVVDQLVHTFACNIVCSFTVISIYLLCDDRIFSRLTNVL